VGRIRTIKPEFFKSRPVGRLTAHERLAFIWLWTEADDAGNVEWDPVLLKIGAWPFDDVLTEDSVRAQGALMREGLVTVYECRGQLYAHVNGWEEHQRINRPSPPRCPAFTDGCAVLTEDSLRTHGALTEDSSPEGKGRERERKVKDPPNPPKGGTRSRAQAEHFDLPDWVPTEAWAGYDEMRRRLSSKAWTVRAQQLAVKTLADLKARGFSPAAVLDQSTANGWKGLFEIKGAQVAALPPSPVKYYRGAEHEND